MRSRVLLFLAAPLGLPLLLPAAIPGGAESGAPPAAEAPLPGIVFVAAPIFEPFVAEGRARLARQRDAFQTLRKPSSGGARIVLALVIRLHSFFQRLTRRRWHA